MAEIAADNKAADPKDKVPATPTTEVKQDPFESERMPGRAADKPAEVTAAPKEDWKQQLAVIQSNTDAIEALKGKEGPVTHDNKMHPDAKELRRQLIEDTDRRFQVAISGAVASGNNADMRMLTRVVQAENCQKQREALQNDAEVKQTLTALGLEKKTVLSQDDVQNAVLNAPTESARNKIAQLVALNDMEAVAKESAGQAYMTKRAGEYLAVAYAKFLIDNEDVTNGITLDKTGKPMLAKEILLDAHGANIAATPEYKEQVQRASDQQIAAQKNLLGIANGDNPEYLLNMGITRGDVNYFQQAYDKAHSEQFNPEKLREQIAKLKTEEATQENLAKIANLEQMTHFRSLTAGYLAAALMQDQNKKPDYKRVLRYLDEASEDPKAAMQIQNERKEPMLQALYQAAMMGLAPNFDESRKLFAQQFKEMGDAGKAALAKAEAEGKKPDQLIEGDEIQTAIRKGQDAVNTADAMIKALGPYGRKIDVQYRELMKNEHRTPEEEAMMQQLKPIAEIMHAKSEAMMMLASFDKASGDNDAAKHLYDEIAKDRGFFEMRPPEFKTQFFDQKTAIQAQYDYDHQSWAGRRLDDLAALPGKAWDWIKNNGKWVAFGVACVAGAVITIATWGTAAPAVAIGLGIVGGGLIGTAAGATVEVAGGHKEASLKGFAEAAWDVAPMAFTGSTIGAMTAGTFAPAAGGGGAAVAGTEGTLAVANTARTAGMFGRLATGMGKVGINTEAYMASGGGVQMFANAGRLAPMLRMTTIGGMSGLPYAYGDARDKGTGLKGFATTYGDYVALSATAGMPLKFAAPTLLGKNMVTTAVEGESNSAGSYLTSVGLRTSSDILSRMWMGKQSIRPTTGAFYPLIGDKTRGPVEQLDGVLQAKYFGNTTHKLDSVLREQGYSEDAIKQLHDQKSEPAALDVPPLQQLKPDASTTAPPADQAGKPGELAIGAVVPETERPEKVNTTDLVFTNPENNEQFPLYLATLKNGRKALVLDNWQVVKYVDDVPATPAAPQPEAPKEPTGNDSTRKSEKPADGANPYSHLLKKKK